MRRAQRDLSEVPSASLDMITEFLFYFFFFKDFIYLFLERRRQGEREGKKHQCVVASCTPPTGDLACNTGLCLDWESNQLPFGSQAGAQSTEPHQPELSSSYFKVRAGEHWGVTVKSPHLGMRPPGRREGRQVSRLRWAHVSAGVLTLLAYPAILTRVRACLESRLLAS